MSQTLLKKNSLRKPKDNKEGREKSKRKKGGKKIKDTRGIFNILVFNLELWQTQPTPNQINTKLTLKNLLISVTFTQYIMSGF